MEGLWSWLREQPFFGPFHSYEIVTDLRHTHLLDKAPDIMTWCNIGPGARRGINRVMGRDKRDHTKSNAEMLEEIRYLLDCSTQSRYWPQWKTNGYVHRNVPIFIAPGIDAKKQWPSWEIREVEHLLCEYDKYQRVQLGEGRPRGVFR